MKRFVSLLITLSLSVLAVYSQISIDDCQRKARANYPLIKRYDLIEKSKAYSLSNIAKSYLPQIQLNAKATYQSDVTKIPLSLPGITIPELNKDQYLAAVEVNQVIWDGGAIRAQKGIAEASAAAEEQQVTVDLYALENRINQLFFGILLLDTQLEQNRILQDELERNYTTIANYKVNGLANQADLDAVKVEQLNAKQLRVQLQSTRQSFIDMLSYMTGEKLPADVFLTKPKVNQEFTAGEMNRPELRWFEAQDQLLESQKALIKASYLPKLGLFVQGGVGRPGLNMLSTDWDPFYIGGVRLTWNFGAFYTAKNDKQKIMVNQNALDTQRETFLFNLNLEQTKENQEIKRLKEQMVYDDEIIALRTNIKKSAEAKWANGALTVTDLMQEISRENLAKQTKAAHEIDLLIAIYNLKNTTNNP
ncbi:MAG: TolC family protein [Dysgonamonadaceae bacterium]|jgi:outer membrane protein TolC|nr:TolC family protein [Dysgonamonadaceae bacterium]